MRTLSPTVVVRTALGARRRAILCAVGAAMSVGSMAGHASATNYVWTGIANAQPANAMSIGTNWQGGVAPPSNDPNTTLTFSPGLTNGAASARNEIAASFLVNSMTWNNSNFGMAVQENSAFSIPPNGTSTGGFKFVASTSGTLPTINLNGTGGASINTTLPDWQLGANLTIGGTGYENLGFAGLFDDGNARSITIAPTPAILAGTPASRMLRMVQFNGRAIYTGGTILDGGYVQAGGFTQGPNTFGAGGTISVTSNGGGIWLTSQFLGGVSATTLQLNGTLNVLGNQVLPFFDATTNPAAPTSTLLVGSGTLAMGGTGTVTVYSNSTGYNGAVVLDRPDVPQVTTNVGTLALSSIAAQNVTNGALTSATSFTLRAGGTLQLNNNIADSKQNDNRVGDNVPITMSSGNITLNGPAAAGVTSFTPSNLNETVGAITASGYNTLTATPGSATTVSTTLTAQSLTRSQSGTFLFRGVALGNAGAGNSGNIFFATAPTGLVGGGGAAGSTSISILPYAIGDTTAAGNGASLVTYDANGIRPLAVSEYATDLVSGATTNARLGAIAANNVAAPTTVNALVVNAPGPAAANAVTVTGSQINLTSGVLLFNTAVTSANGGSASIANDVNFGSAEAQVFSTFTSPGTVASTLTLSGSLLGSGGLTKSGNAPLVLTGNNSGLTGTLTVNAGIVNFNSGAALPGTGQIVANGAGSTAGLTYSGTSPVAVTRDIAVNTGLLLASSSTAGQTLTLSGQISGAGGVHVATTGDVVLSGNNTYTGPTSVAAGTGALRISSDANLGNGGAVGMNGGTLQVDGNWTTSRLVNFNTASTMNVSGNNTATLNGPLTNVGPGGSSSTAALTKTGTGTLVINSLVNSYTSAITINGGKVLINDALGASSAANSITVNANGTLGGSGTIPRNVLVNSGGTLAPGNSPGILTVLGSVTLNSGSNFAVELNGSTAGNGANNYDRLVLQGNLPVTLTGSNLVLSMGYNHLASDVYWIVVKDGLNAATGVFSQGGVPLNEGDSVLLGYENWGFGPVAITAQISYRGNFDALDPFDGFSNDVVLYNVIPAPGAASLMTLGGLLAARRRRR